ncbi:MAG: DsrE family protein [Actinomycetota bacterium]
MTKLLVHITCGQDDPTRAALGFLVAKTAQEEGHQVAVFLAGDGVNLIRDEALDMVEGVGTGRLRDHFDAFAAGGGHVFLSGMSSKARGIGEDALEGKPAEMAMPNVLVKLVAESDNVVTY